MAATEFANFLRSHVGEVEPLSREMNLAQWNASVSGRESDFERSAQLQIEFQRIYADADTFEKVRGWREDQALDDPIDRRQIDLLYHAYLRNQIDPKLNERITRLGNSIERQFNVYRATVDGRTVTSNDVLKILRESRDTDLRRRAWDAVKQVGAVVRDDLITLVKLRNEAASSLGYRDYYSMSMELGEQNEEEVIHLFDELARLTEEPFRTLKREADEHLAGRFAIKPAAMRPWHYEDPFFQEAPQVYSVDLDKYYRGHRIPELTARFFDGIGLNVTDILARSDLYEKPGKDQHAFCTDIDRRGDVRILANVKSDEAWTGTMLHELGHAVHDKHIDSDLPFLLRQEAHTFTTEGIAMLFGQLSKHAGWIQHVLGITDGEREKIADALRKSLRLHQLVFARWSQVMMRFERELYLDPDQDLDRRWWELVEKYQMLVPPDNRDFPHWASKTHVVNAPVYYHNYLLGELLASQLRHFIVGQVLTEANDGRWFDGQRVVGDYLKQNVFKCGARFRWDSLIRRATGADLSPKYFVDEFVEA